MVEVKLHDIGEGMTEADINCFLVKPGDTVKADDPLVEVQTDKMTAEIPAPFAGKVKEFLVEAGQTVAVGTTILILEADVPHQAVSQEQKPQSKEPPPKIENKVMYSTTSIVGRIMASPYTRKIARENGVDIQVVKGTGPAGRIMDEDVYRFIQAGKEEVPVNQVVHKEITKALPHETSNQSTIPFRGRRKQIAKKMTQSLYTIPHCTHFEEVDVTDLISFRKELKEIHSDISATAFFIKALSVALKEYPIFNARLDEENECIHLNGEHNIGIAVDTEDGLIVPVVKNVEQKSLRTIHAEMKGLTKKALENQLTGKDISGGTFTISNVGPLGGSIGATPIIQHPEVALVSFHKTKKMPVVTEDDQIVIRSIMNMSMSFDHRVADGATAVRFTSRFAQLIKNPKMLLLELI